MEKKDQALGTGPDVSGKDRYPVTAPSHHVRIVSENKANARGLVVDGIWTPTDCVQTNKSRPLPGGYLRDGTNEYQPLSLSPRHQPCQLARTHLTLTACFG